MSIDTNKNYVFTGGFDDGEVGVFNIEKPGRVIYNFNLIRKNLLNKPLLWEENKMLDKSNGLGVGARYS